MHRADVATNVQRRGISLVVIALHAKANARSMQRAGRLDVLLAASRGCLLSALLCMSSPFSMGQPHTQASVSGITVISLERGCFGCATGSVVVLRRDGTATWTLIGNARHGTVDQVAKGSVTLAAFDALAGLAVKRRFFDLNDAYDDPAVQDGAWATIRITRSGVEKQVFVRSDAGPADAQTIAAAIDDLRSKISFVPE